MKALRSAFGAIIRPQTLNPNFSPKFPNSFLTLPKPFAISESPTWKFSTILNSTSSSSSSMADVGNISSFDANLESQFGNFRTQLDESGNLRERIRNVALEIESVTRIMHANLLLVHQSRPVTEVLEKAKSQISVLKEHFNRLAEIIQECPGQYYRYHNDWRSETQTVVSLLAFMHWLETGNLLLHLEAQEKLGFVKCA